MPEKFYITTPIYYVNARPHIGHAYSTIVADVLARRHLLLGENVFFLTGTDEHGQKVERSAAAAGVPPQQFTDEVSGTFRDLWKRMGITNDDYIRTTEPRHKQGVQKLWRLLEERGAIYLSSYTGQYCVSDEAFVDVPPGAPCPDCGRLTESLTEENYFFRLSNYQRPLIDLIESNTLTIQPDSARNEVLSFLKGDTSGGPSFAALAKDGLSGEARPLSPGIAYSAQGTPYLPGALKDLSISRTSFTWGIPVPGNEKHVIYVWLDALANYITALGYGSDDEALFEKYWPADIHLVGKEITRFHCVYWPAFLMAAGLPTPKAVVANGWLLFQDSNNEASKMSKSKGNVVRAETILDAFGEHVYKKQFPDSTKQEQDLFATDVLRYFLLREIPFGQDGNFSFDAMWSRYDSDLGSKYGNLVSRVTSLITQFFSSGYVRGPHSATIAPSIVHEDEIHSPYSLGLKSRCLEIAQAVDTFFKTNQFTKALEAILDLVGETNEFLTSEAPWKLLKQVHLANYSEEEFYKLTVEHGLALAKFERITYTAAEAIRFATALIYPVLPYATAQVWSQLGLGDIEQAAKNGALRNLEWGGLEPGTKLGPLSPIFPRADKGLAQIMIDMEAAKAAPAQSPLADEKTAAAQEPQDTNHPGAGPRTATLPDPAPGATVAGSHAVTTERIHTPHTEAAPSGIFAADQGTPQIVIDDFLKVDLRVAQVLVAECIPKADKLLRLEVDLGYERRQILSGIAEWYTPEELIGRRIVIVANLAPRKMRGLESHGMLLAASAGDNTKPILTTFADTETLPLGSRVR